MQRVAHECVGNINIWILAGVSAQNGANNEIQMNAKRDDWLQAFLLGRMDASVFVGYLFVSIVMQHAATEIIKEKRRRRKEGWNWNCE